MNSHRIGPDHEDDKGQEEVNEDNSHLPGDTSNGLAERSFLSEADNIRIRRKTDRHVLIILVVAYFWQIFDKAVWGYGNIFGLAETLHLHGNQYSLASSMHAFAQIAWMPFSTFLIVRVPSRYLMTALLVLWGTSQACLAAAKNAGGLYSGRFFLGLFEAACLPLYSVLTAQWYRRSEQPLRVAAWYSTNGISTIFAALLAFGVGRVDTPHIVGWQLIYLVAGLLTIITAPFVWWFLDSDIQSARFFTAEEKTLALERLRGNQTGAGSNVFLWSHIYELLRDSKTYLWFANSVLLNVGTSSAGTFGPTLIKNFGYDKYVTALLGMPYGFLQFLVICFACWVTQRWRLKSPVLIGLLVMALIGLVLLYVEGSSSHPKQSIALLGYYLLAPVYGANTILLVWIIANTAGQTKKSATMMVYQLGGSVGQLTGPLLFNAKDAPHYLPGVRSVMALYAALITLVVLQAGNLWRLNRIKESQRVALGKPRFINDTSMSLRYQQFGEAEGFEVGDQGLSDITDVRNEEFVYVF